MPSDYPFPVSESLNEILELNDIKLSTLSDDPQDILDLDSLLAKQQLHTYSKLHNPQKEFLILMANDKGTGKLVGAAVVELAGTEPYVYNVASIKAGVGTQLVLALSDTFATLGYASFSLHSAERALSFYKKLKFHQENKAKFSSHVPLENYEELIADLKRHHPKPGMKF